LRLRGANRTAGTRGDGELHVIGETVNEMLDHVSARPVSSHPHQISGAVSADEIFLAGCAASPQ
jgi:hypothetical protein